MNIINVYGDVIEAVGDKVLVNGEPMKPEDTEKVISMLIKAMVTIVK